MIIVCRLVIIFKTYLKISSEDKMSQQQIQCFRDEYMKKMIVELNKFFRVYNTLTTHNKVEILGENLPLEYYSKIIKVLGNFVTTVDLEKLFLTPICIQEGTIDLSVFIDTEYMEVVRDFLLSLKKAVDTNIDEDVDKYLKSKECVFNVSEQIICKQFYEKSRDLGKSMTVKSFENISEDITSKESVEKSKDALSSFNHFVSYVSKDGDRVKTLEKFDAILKKIALSKVHTPVIFNIDLK
jgi:hypothetical protein